MIVKKVYTSQELENARMQACVQPDGFYPKGPLPVPETQFSLLITPQSSDDEVRVKELFNQMLHEFLN